MRFLLGLTSQPRVNLRLNVLNGCISSSLDSSLVCQRWKLAHSLRDRFEGFISFLCIRIAERPYTAIDDLDAHCSVSKRTHDAFDRVSGGCNNLARGGADFKLL